ncbi:MAG: hypothetical protein H6766_00305 [Candidatus Peribacteria bacterium]|nr:MAG: hypothetical protein H6766_00305 [Candidatus Peribacteria bacterium]
MNIAQLTNFTTGVMRYGGADVSPWEWQNNKLQFSQQDSFLEYGKDVWRSGFDLKTLKSYVDTDVTSKDAVTTLYPMLQKPGQGEAYARWLNERNIWHRESNPEKIKELRNTVDQTLVTINNGLPASEQFYIDTDKSHGHIVTINRKNSGIKE